MFGSKHPKLEVVIGAESVFKGELTSKGTIRIDGTFEGNIAADCIIVGESGNIVGDIQAAVLIAGGKVHGNVRAGDHVEIQPKGEVYGDIHTLRLMVAEGAVFEGRSSMQKNRSEIEYRPAEVMVS
jgi:cytoskeletal protein CcmA (bactofilin family)